MKKQLLTFILSLSFLFSFSQIANQPSDLSLCDSNNDGFEAFDLTSVIAQVIGGQTNVTISFYETQVDVDTGTNIITSPSSYTNSAPNLQTIYVRLEEDATGNYDTTSFNIIVNPLPLLTPPTPLVLCDDGIPDGLATFDLSSKNSEITGNNPNYAISYYSSLVDADNEINPLPTIYTNTTNPQSVFVRVVDVNTGCYNTTTLNLVVEQSPIANTPQPLRYCDPDNDGFGAFNLIDADDAITGGAAGLEVTYYETLSNANNNVDALDTSVPYNNLVVDTQTLYARVENPIATYCGATIVELQLIVQQTPILGINDISICQGDSVVAVTNLNPVLYQFEWSYNGVIISDETLASLTITQAGNYMVEVFELNTLCTSISTFNVAFIDCTTDLDSDNVSNGNEDIDGDGNLENDDTDIDGIPNYLDDDDDGDNVLTIDEDYNNNGDPTDDDTDMSGIPDYLEANVALGINEYSLNNFDLYPNPAKNRIMIQLTNSNFETGKLNIYNIQGKMIFKDIKLVEQASIIDISSLENGLYFVELIVGNTSTVQKLIVN